MLSLSFLFFLGLYMYIFWGKVVFQVWLLNNWQRPSIASIDFSLRERQTRERVYLYKTTDCAESALPDDLWHYQRDRQWLGSRAPYSTTSRSWARLAANSHIQDGRAKKSAPWTTRHIYSLLSCLSLIYKSFLISFPSTLGRLMNEPSFFDATRKNR